jgi:signal transduction histidine kinase/ligand-binding sensor domain-containing protein
MKPKPVARTLLICLLGLLLCGMAYSQRRDRTIFQFQHTGWTAKEGAPSPIWRLAQTTDGYLWMATQTGLYRFDGIQFELYQPPSGQRFRSDNIHSLKATPDGGLWIGMSYGGADFLKDGRITNYGEPEGLPPGSVDGFTLDREGVVWVAAFGGLGRFDGSRWQRIGLDWGYSGKLARALFLDREGTIWVASEDALFFLSRGSREFRKCADHLGITTSIGQTQDGTLWLSESRRGKPRSGSNRDWTVRAIRPTPLEPAAAGQALPRIVEIDAVNGSFIDHAGSLWISSTDGVFRVPYPERLEKDKPFPLDGRTAQRFRQKDGLTSDAITDDQMVEDSQGDVWMGTGLGLDRFRESNVVPITTDLHRTFLVAGDHTDAWASVINFPQISLVHLRGLAGSSQPFPAIPTAGYRDPKGMIWLGEPGGLWKFEDGRLVRYPLPKAVALTREFDVQAITSDTTGGLWVSIVRSGVYHWTKAVWSHFGNRNDLPGDTAVSLLTDSAGRIWFGYMGSKIALLDHDRVKTFSSADGLQIGGIQAIYEHARRIWLGGERGLALYENNRFQSLIPDGDARFTGVSGIVETANGDLWLNAAPGIFHVRASEIEQAIKEPAHHVQYELFGILDGFTGKAIQLRPIPTEVESSDGRLWFSTTVGVVQIDPDHLLRNTVAPSVFIRSVDSDGVMHSGPGVINLPPRTTNIHVRYTAPNLSIPERVRYRYELEGADRNWLDAGNRREAFYTNLGPGHYRFHVIACNEDGVWNNTGATINFTIAPAWFQTYWFFALCAAAAFFVLWVLYRLRVRQVANAMSLRFDDRLAERTRIARDLHDTFLQTIQGSKLVADSALRQAPDSARMRGALEQLSVWLGRATEEGRAALNSLRTSTTETNDLAEAFRRSIGECQIHNSMDASFSVAGEFSEMHPIVRDEVYRIGYEAIRNACVHSQATHLQVELTYAEDLILRVRDNGVGIDPAIMSEGKEGHFGLQGMRERASRIMARLAVETSTASGTEIKLVVPGSIIYRSTVTGSRKLRAVKSLLKRLGLKSGPSGS